MDNNTNTFKELPHVSNKINTKSNLIWESTVFLCCWQVQKKCKKQEFVYIKMLFSHINNDKIMIQSKDTI